MAARPDSFGETQNADPRYPRSLVLRMARTALRYWWLLLIAYAGIAVRNLFSLVSTHGLGEMFNPARLGYALLAAQIGSEPWRVLVVIVGLAALFVAGRIAYRDYEHEYRVLSHRAVEDLHRAARNDSRQATRGAILSLVEQTIQRPVQPVPVTEKAGSSTQAIVAPPRDVPDRVAQPPERIRQSGANRPPFDQGLLPRPGYLVGRQRTLLWLEKRLRDRSQPGWTIICGPDGFDKGALAAEMVRDLRAEGRFSDGVGVVLADTTDPVAVLRRALARFDPLRRWPEGADIAELRDQAQQVLKRKDALIILKDVDDASRVDTVFDTLAAAGAQVLVLAYHGLPPERVVEGAQRESEQLSIKDGIRLLYRRMQRPLPTSREELHGARAVVHHLAGNSLAIALAGNYAASTGIDIQQVRSSLDNVLAEETWEDFPRGIGAALRLSLRSLPGDARRLLTALAAFATEEFGTQAAEVLAQALGIGHAERALTVLVNWGLLERWDREDLPRSCDWRRLRLHPLLARMLRHELEGWNAQDRERAHHGVASWYAEYAQGQTFHILAADQRNIAGAIERAYASDEPYLVAELCENMQAFWVARWRTEQCLKYLPKGIEAAEKLALLSGSPHHLRRLADLKLALAQVHQRLGELEKAWQELQENLHSRRKQHDRYGEARVLRALGKLEWNRGRFLAAEPFFTEALQLAEATKDLKLEGVCWGDLGRLAQARGQLDRAEECYGHSLDRADRGEDLVGKSRVLFHLSQVARVRGKLDDAERLVKESIAFSTARGDLRGEAQGLWQRGLIAMDRGHYDEAERDYRDSLDLRRMVHDRRGEAKSLIYLGIVALALDRLSEAKKHLDDAIDIAQRTHDERAKGIALSQLARIEQRRGNWPQAERYFKQALDIAQQVENRRGEAVDLLELGGIAARRGDIDAALEQLDKAADAADEVGDTSTLARAAAALGHLHHERGFDASAQTWYQHALDADRRLSDQHNVAVDLMFLGQLAQSRNDLGTAVDFLSQAVQASRDAGDRRVESAALSALGQLESARPDSDRAREYLQEALEIDQQLGDRRSEALDLVALAELARSQGNQAGAIALYDQALEIQRAQRDKLAVAISLFDLSTTSREEGDVVIELDRLTVAHIGFEITKAPQAALTTQLLGELRTRVGEQAYADALSRVAANGPEVAYGLDPAAWEACIRALLEIGPSNAAAS